MNVLSSRILIPMGILLGILVPSIPIVVHAEASLTVEARPRSISVGDTVRLTVQAVTQDQGTLDAPDMDDWDIVSQSQQTSLSYGSGGQKKISIIELSLQPNKVGTLTIQPFVLKSRGKTYRSQTIPIAVTGNKNPAPMPRANRSTSRSPSSPTANTPGERPSAPTDEVAFLVWEVSRDALWLGEPLDARLCIYYRDGLRVSQFKNSKIDLAGFWNEEFDHESSQARRVRVGSLMFIRDEIARYTLFPIKAGALKMPEIETEMVVQRNSFFRRGRRSRIKRTVPEVPITVKALPTRGRPKSYRGIVVGSTRLTAQVDRRTVADGKGVELTVTTDVAGLMQNVPEIKIPDTGDWQIFPASSDTSVQHGQRGRVRSIRKQSWLLRPKKAGRLEIPGFEIAYFDPAKQTYRVARTRAIQIKSTGKPSTARGATAPGQSSNAAVALNSIRADIDPSRGFGLGSRPVWFYASLYGAPFLFLCFVGFGRVRKHREVNAGSRTIRTAGRTAIKALDKIQIKDNSTAEGYGELSQVVLTFLDDRFSEKVRGLTHQQMKDMLRKEGLEDGLIVGVIETLEAADFARFARAGDAGDLRVSIERARDLISQVDRAVA